jgi:uncharacterized protein (DUF2236 family)
MIQIVYHPFMSGLFGPESVTWRVHASPAITLVGGLRSLVIQALHPLAMAGVAQHSDYRERPLKRLQRTAEFVAVTTFGTVEEAERAAAIVRHVHRKVAGIDPVTGRAYSASDPDTALWVHCVEIHSFLAAHEAYGGALSPGDRDRYFAENAVVAELLGVPADTIPRDSDAMRAFFSAQRPGLCVSSYARDAIDFVVSPPLTGELAPYWIPLRILARAAIALVPRDLRRLIGLSPTALGDAVSHAQVRALDAVLVLPGADALLKRTLGERTRAVAVEARAAA